MASNWYTAQIMLYKSQLNPAADSGKLPISQDEYLLKVGKLMSLPILREKAPDWLHVAVEHLSKPDAADAQQRLQEALADAAAAYERGQEALAEGDFATYGETQDDLVAALQRAEAAANELGLDSSAVVPEIPGASASGPLP